jgi:hypothetical protein
VQLATTIVYKELFLAEADLAPISNEQSALIDLLVMRKSKLVLGIGLSTFSFYLNELRLMDGVEPADTQLLMISQIGSDELFFSCGLAAVKKRRLWANRGLLLDICRTWDLKPCFQPQTAT